MKISDFLIGLIAGGLAFVAAEHHLGPAWAILVALFAGGSALLLSNAFRLTQGIR